MKWKLALGIAIGAWSCASAWAYIPPSDFIVKGTAGKHSGAKTVRIKAQVSGIENNKPNGIHFKETALYSSKSDTLKSWVTDDQDQVLYSIERKVASPALADLLLFSSDASELIQALRQDRIPIGKANESLFLSRWKNQVVWVMAGPAEPALTSALWIEKDTFLPVRLLKAGSDLRFENYRFYHEFPYPKVITLAKTGAIKLEAEVIDIGINSDASSKLPPGLENSGSGFPAGYTDAGNAAPTAVRELIKQYYEFIR